MRAGLLIVLTALAVVAMADRGFGASTPATSSAHRHRSHHRSDHQCPESPRPPGGRRRPAGSCHEPIYHGASAPATWHVLSRPIAPSQLLAIPFGAKSHWLQPWRAYLDTRPAATLRNAIGINFNMTPAAARHTAHLLADSGFTRARIEESWNHVSYDNPGVLGDDAAFRQKLQALKTNGIRPLILLNSNQLEPCPVRRFSARLVGSAVRGSRQVLVDPATARAIVPGKTGLDSLSPGYPRAADLLFTAVDSGGVATLSRPLPKDLLAGPHSATTLKYAPFDSSRDDQGHPGPAFQETMQGWLSYVATVTRRAREVLGSSNFDIEVWNELSFGSAFLDSGNYYGSGPTAARRATVDALLANTVAYLRDPAHGLPGVRVGNGFASQTPFPSGATAPPGLSAQDKHPYRGIIHFPEDAVSDTIRPVDAIGGEDYTAVPIGGGETKKVPHFIPSYDAFFPEYFLTAIQTETLVRELSPFTTSLFGTPHGRLSHPAGASAPEVWITEMNMDPGGTDLADPSARAGSSPFSNKQAVHMQAKATLRSVVAYVNKGVSAIHFFGVDAGNLSMVAPRFLSAAAKSGSRYPGAEAGGEIMTSMRRLVGSFGRGTAGAPRALSLLSIADNHDHYQFAGDGTAAHPPLYDRDVLAFLPFQVTQNRFAVPIYVMTRDLSRVWRRDARATDPTRFDLPPERFRLTIGGVRGTSARVAMTDPLTGAEVPAAIVARSGNRLVIDVLATDSPRVLTIQDGP